jgi:hypothetical protein
MKCFFGPNYVIGKIYSSGWNHVHETFENKVSLEPMENPDILSGTIELQGQTYPIVYNQFECTSLDHVDYRLMYIPKEGYTTTILLHMNPSICTQVENKICFSKEVRVENSENMFAVNITIEFNKNSMHHIKNMMTPEMPTTEIVKWDESKWLVATSITILPSACLSFERQYYLQGYGLLWTIFCSINYWRKATYGTRRHLDLMFSKVAFYTFLYNGIMNLYGFGLICYPNLAAIIYCYNKANHLFEVKNKQWLHYHMLFHTLVGIQGYIITSYLP